MNNFNGSSALVIQKMWLIVPPVILDYNHKIMVVQWQLWRIKIDSQRDIEELRRLHAPEEDFFYIEVNPGDPSQG